MSTRTRNQAAAAPTLLYEHLMLRKHEPRSVSTGFLRFPQIYHSPIHRFSAGISIRHELQIHQKSRIGGDVNFEAVMSKHADRKNNLFQFPLPFEPDPQDIGSSREKRHQLIHDWTTAPAARGAEIVISGTYRKDNEGLKNDYEEFRDLGCEILSPTSVHVVSEADGFVFMEGETSASPQDIEVNHLNAIQHAQFMWLHAPGGYVGLSAALEVGFAHAIGIPIYSRAPVSDPIISTFVSRVASPADIVKYQHEQHVHIPAPAVQAFQKYYRRAAIQRGYASESARDTLLLMVEEVGELARAIRKTEKLSRHGDILEDEAMELADVFIYVVHLANVLNIDLARVVKQKELLNVEKLLSRRVAK